MVKWAVNSGSALQSLCPLQAKRVHLSLRKAAKSSQSPGGEDDPSATMRAIPAPRSPSSTVLPARSQAYRRLVSRNCLIFMLGIHDCATTRTRRQTARTTIHRADNRELTAAARPGPLYLNRDNHDSTLRRRQALRPQALV